MNKEKLQEDQYFYPYHWVLSAGEYAGREYYGYINYLLGLFNYSKKNILDAGCGDGRFSSLLNSVDGNVVGLDYSDRAISMAKIMEPSVDFVIGDVHNFSLEKKFDYIFFVEVIEHIKPIRIKEVLNSAKNHLTNEGLIIITVPSDRIPVNVKHYQHFNLEKIKNLASDSNLNIIDIKFLGFSGIVINILYKLLDNRYYQLKKISYYFNMFIYPKYIQQKDVSKAERFVIILEKK